MCEDFRSLAKKPLLLEFPFALRPKRIFAFNVGKNLGLCLTRTRYIRCEESKVAPITKVETVIAVSMSLALLNGLILNASARQEPDCSD